MTPHRFLRWIAVAAVLAGCGGESQDPLPHVPLSSDLRPAIEASRRSLEAGDQGTARVVEDLDRYYALWEMFSRRATRSVAEDSLFVLWHGDMESVLWPEVGAFNWNVLSRYSSFDSMFTREGFPDTSTALGAYLRDFRSFRLRSVGAGLRRARADLAQLDPFAQVWVDLRFSRLERLAGRTDEATRMAIETLPSARALGGWRLEMETWFQALRALRDGDHLDDALHAAAMAEELARAVAQHTGNVWIVQLARSERARILAARREVEPALDLYTSCADEALKHGLTIFAAQCLNAAGRLTDGSGDYELGLNLYRRALNTALSDSDSLNVPRVLANIARRHLLLGNLDSCRIYLGKADTWIQAFPNPANRARFPLMQAEYFARIGDYTTVDSLLAISAELIPRFSYVANIAELHKQIIEQNMESGRPDLAYRSIAALDSLRDRLTSSFADRNEVFDLELASAEFLARQGLFEDASRALDRTKAALDARPDPRRAWLLMRARGDLARRRGDSRAAEASYRACLSASEDRGDADQAADSRLRLGFALLDQNRFDEVPKVLAETGTQSYGGRYRTRLSTMLLRSVAELRAGRFEAALDILDEARALCRPGSPPDLLARLDLQTGRALAGLGKHSNASRAYARVKEQLTVERDRPLGDPTLYFDTDLRRELAESMLALSVKDREAVVRGSQAANPLRELQALLPQWIGTSDGANRFAEPQLVYFVGRSASFRWTMSGGDIALQQLPGEDSLLVAMAPVLADMQRPGREPVIAEVAALSSMLGGAPADWSAGATLTIVPDGPLFAVPWPALLRTGPPGRVWIDAGPIALADAPRSQQDPARSVPATNARLLALGVDATSHEARRGLNALRHAEREAREIHALWPDGLGSLRVGADADWRSIDATELSNAGVIHIASHIVVYRGQADRATLLLAGSSGTPATSAEIAQLDLAARLVFLSGCEAAEGVRRGVGPAHAGLARAFLEAGARCVIAPSAPIDDETARLFAGRFYQHWLSGMSLEAALWTAQKDLRDERQSHPYYWAFYQLIS